MADDDLKCPKCNGEMEEGFIKDETLGMVLVSQWVEGPPQTSLWTVVKIRGKKKLTVKTYRCEDCGYLESYAN